MLPATNITGVRMPFEALGIPETALHAPRTDRDRRLDSRVSRLLISRARGATLGKQQVRRRILARGARRAVAAADHVDHAVAAHRIADDAGAAGVHHRRQEAAGTQSIQALDGIQDEQLIERPVVERAAKRLLIIVGAVLVIDRHRHEALAREVLADVTHQEAVAGIPVRNDHERISAGGRHAGALAKAGRSVANGLAI